MNKLLVGIAGALVVGAGLYAAGLLPLAGTDVGIALPRVQVMSEPLKAEARDEPAPAVTVIRAAIAPLRETVLVTGTLVPRLEVLVAPEVEGLRVMELLVEEGDRVETGQIMARLEGQTLRAQLAQVEATRAKTMAAIAQARSNIVAAEARQVEMSNALDRARPLSKSGVMPEATLDQRESAARTAAAQLLVAQDGLKVSEAESAQVEAQYRDLMWKLSRAEVRAPVDGIVSRRTARIGGLASGAAVAQPMFHLIARGEIELEAEVPETDMGRLKPGQPATIMLADGSEARGAVRLVNPEVDKPTRQGKVRIGMGDSAHLRIGSFGRGNVVVRSAEAVVVPASAVLIGSEGAYVQLVENQRIVGRRVVVGMRTADIVEIESGLKVGEIFLFPSPARFSDQATW